MMAGGMPSKATGTRRCSPICAISLPSREYTRSGSCDLISRSEAAAGISGARNWYAPANPMPTSTSSARETASAAPTILFIALRPIAKTANRSLLRPGAVCIVAADSRANPSKGGGAKPPVYRGDPTAAGLPAGAVQAARPVRPAPSSWSSPLPPTVGSARPPLRPVAGFSSPRPQGATRMTVFVSPRTILLGPTLIYSGAGALKLPHNRGATS